MATTTWEEKFAVYQKMNTVEQEQHKNEIMKLFKEFWVTMPSEELFVACVNTLIMFPEILYVMSTRQIEITYLQKRREELRAAIKKLKIEQKKLNPLAP